jgi:hypothetical protein
LGLNPITSNTEDGSLVAISDDRDKLLNWYKGEFADEPYYSVGVHSFPAKGDFPEELNDQYKYYKVFKKGSNLEWFNPMMDENTTDHYGHGIGWEWVDETELPNIKIFRIF